MKGLKIPFISETRVRELLSIDEALAVIEGVYRDHGIGEAFLSEPASLDLRNPDQGSFFKMKGACLQSHQIVGFRLFGKGRSASLGLCYLYDPVTAMPKAVIDESWLYLVRSGLTAAVAARYLARLDSRKVGLLGCGKIVPYVLMGLRNYFPLDKIWVNSKRKESRVAFSGRMEKEIRIEVIPVDSPREAVAEAGIVITSTNADEPILRPEWVQTGAFVCALGESEEIHHTFLDWASKLVVDDFSYCMVLGNISAWVKKRLREEAEIRAQVWAEIGEVVAGKKAGRETEGENILAVIQGMASCDIGLANYVLEKAIQKGVDTCWEL
jgi:alanine dehydrogenase